jgi:GntR family transcriptional repressor for pyruvate dehydrogenase complex
MRRGRGGGLIVDHPTQTGIQRAMATYLQFNGVQLRHLFDVREMLEMAVVERLIERASDEDLEQLQRVVDGQAAVGLRFTESNSFHLLLAEMTDNPAMLLFTETLIQLTFAHLDPTSGGQARPEASAEGHVAHKALVAAMRARDLPAARKAVIGHLERVAEWF